jgi:competence protein ComEC
MTVNLQQMKETVRTPLNFGISAPVARMTSLRVVLAVSACVALAACATSSKRDARKNGEDSLPSSISQSIEIENATPVAGEYRVSKASASENVRFSSSTRLRAAGSEKRKTVRRKSAVMALAAETRALTFSPRKLLPNEMAVHMIDVGQGDAMLVEFNCGAALIDAGGEWSGGSNSMTRLTQYLDMFFNQRRPDLQRTLDLVIVSHGHADHAKGLPLLHKQGTSFGPLTIRNVVDSGYDTDGATFNANTQVKFRDAVIASGGSAQSIRTDEILWYSGATSAVIDPFPGCMGEVDPQLAVLWGDWSNYIEAPPNPNHHSVVTRLDFGESSFLFTGDIQTESDGEGGLDFILKDYQDDLSAFDVDVLKIAHHGAENGTTQALVDATTPCIGIMGVGDPSRNGPGTAGGHGHPRHVALDLLQASGGGVTAMRPTRRIQSFNSKDEPAVRTDIDRAIFATHWDGHFVVFADAGGRLEVETEQGEDVPVDCAL